MGEKKLLHLKLYKATQQIEQIKETKLLSNLPKLEMQLLYAEN